MTLVLDVAVEEERTARKEKAMRITAEMIVNGEAEIAKLEKNIQVIKERNKTPINFDDPAEVSNFLQRNGVY